MLEQPSKILLESYSNLALRVKSLNKKNLTQKGRLLTLNFFKVFITKIDRVRPVNHSLKN